MPPMSIFVNPCQKGNPILNHLVNVQFQYADILPDYIVGDNHAILFLSIKYHKMYPDYIYQRFKMISSRFSLRVLLVHIDSNDFEAALRELTKSSFISNWTIFLAWSPQEAAKYVETFKTLEHKSPDRIKEKKKDDFLDQAVNFLAKIPSLNSTDATSLLLHFGSIRGIANATEKELRSMPGLGPIKVKRILEAFTCPFVEAT